MSSSREVYQRCVQITVCHARVLKDVTSQLTGNLSFPPTHPLQQVVPLHTPSFTLPEAETRAAFNEKTKMVIFNTPHNPSGHIATREELALLSELCLQHNVIALADEVGPTIFAPSPLPGRHTPVASRLR